MRAQQASTVAYTSSRSSGPGSDDQGDHHAAHHRDGDHIPVMSGQKEAAPEGGPSQGGNAQGGQQHRYATFDAALHNLVVNNLDGYEAGCRRDRLANRRANEDRPPDAKRPGAGPGLKDV